jgi:hypothetical protein
MQLTMAAFTLLRHTARTPCRCAVRSVSHQGYDPQRRVHCEAHAEMKYNALRRCNRDIPSLAITYRTFTAQAIALISEPASEEFQKL